MDYNRLIEELQRGWDALESFPVTGYASRARINLAQEMILSVYNEIVKVKKAAEKEDMSEIPGEE